MCQDHDRSPGLAFRWGKRGFQVPFAVASPGTAEWEGNGRGQCGAVAGWLSFPWGGQVDSCALSKYCSYIKHAFLEGKSIFAT